MRIECIEKGRKDIFYAAQIFCRVEFVGGI